MDGNESQHPPLEKERVRLYLRKANNRRRRKREIMQLAPGKIQLNTFVAEWKKKLEVHLKTQSVLPVEYMKQQ